LQQYIAATEIKTKPINLTNFHFTIKFTQTYLIVNISSI